MKILIAVPTFETIYPDTFKSIYDMEIGEHEAVFDFVRGYDVSTARNNISQLTIDCGADYVLMVDNDVILPKDALMNLLEHDEDVMLGYYAHRDKGVATYSGKVSVCRLCNDDGEPYFGYPRESMYDASKLLKMRSEGAYKAEIHGGGMGCALIKADLLRLMDYPWFRWVDNGKGMPYLSEDLHFCERCKAIGVKIYVDTRVACGHVLRNIQYPK